MMEWAEQEFPDGQEGLVHMLERGQIPREHDLRGARAEHMAQFLETGEAVGAFKVTR